MTTKEIALYISKQCRFRMKNGKEVFGVIFEDSNGEEKQYYFASANDHDRYEAAIRSNDLATAAMIKQISVQLSDIILAERMAS